MTRYLFQTVNGVVELEGTIRAVGGSAGDVPTAQSDGTLEQVPGARPQTIADVLITGHDATGHGINNLGDTDVSQMSVGGNVLVQGQVLLGAALNVMLIAGGGDPSAGAGVAAGLGSLYLRNNGELWSKTGAAATDWQKVVVL